MDSIIGDVVFVVLAVVGLYYLISCLGKLLARALDSDRGGKAIHKCVVYLWIENDVSRTESVLRNLNKTEVDVPVDYVIVLDGLNEDVKEICELFAKSHKNIHTAAFVTECVT